VENPFLKNKQSEQQTIADLMGHNTGSR
jgi:hypothetical protein